ncbi:hypothetical protein VKT23_010782 [Stygiomarasmius scandens]|uniref:NADH:flavin oxidoreductase/NADH oxidase N-terminal domain-containing protein n=1 Tax=Marasmiellus scandens TaxID=2682957 RepID=A0ABR1JB05_9AGAR
MTTTPLLKDTPYPALFTPLQVRPLTLRNRFLMAAMTRDRNVPMNVPTDLMVEYCRQRARGGAALIVSEAVVVSQQGTPWAHPPGIWNEEQVRAWKKITDAVHQEGAYIYAQLWHVGRISHAEAPEQIASGEPVYAPSAIVARESGNFRFIPGQPSCSMPSEIQDPWKFVEIYRDAAINAKNAGFDGVEVQCGGGWLVDEFLDSSANKRTDEWGGSVENRSRFGLEILKAVMEVFGPGRVGVKLTPAGGYNDVGMPLQETLNTLGYFITEADKLSLSYFLLLRYMESFDPIIEGKRRGTNHDVVETWKPFIKNCHLFVNGGFTPQEASDLIVSGKVAGVFFARPFIANPDFPKRLLHGVALNAEIDMKKLYGPSDGSILKEAELRKGYTDYPDAGID